MNAALTYRPGALFGDFSPSIAESSAAKVVVKTLHEIFRSLAKAESFQAAAMRELEDTFLDCFEENWDGYEAAAVPKDAFLQAQEILTLLLRRFPAPTASASPTGSLTLEWVKSNDRRLMVSLNGKPDVAYAALFGSEAAYGVATFVKDIPLEVTKHLNRLFYV